jgi:hypothetical protein
MWEPAGNINPRMQRPLRPPHQHSTIHHSHLPASAISTFDGIYPLSACSKGHLGILVL